MNSQILVYGKTDRGKVRKNNEDNFLILKNNDYVVLSVCDGMGGHNAGEVASKMAINFLKNYVNKNVNLIKNKNEEERINSLNNLFSDENLINLCNEINKKIYDESQINENYSGMGTTLNAVFIFNKIAKVINIGDSRTYLIRKGSISQITKDHSLIQEEKDKGLYNEEDLEKIIPKNIITRAIGIKEDVEPDIYTIEIEEEDKLILTTDGIHDLIKDDEIFKILNGFNLKFSVRNLINLAKKRGGYDNMTIITAHIKKF